MPSTRLPRRLRVRAAITIAATTAAVLLLAACSATPTYTDNGTIAVHTTPTTASQPEGITAGPDGNMWFVEQAIGKVARITPAGVITEYTIGPNTFPADIVTGPDGNLWFTEGGTPSGIGTIDITTHVVSSFPTTTLLSGPFGIASAPDGRVWFTETNGGKIGAINPSTHLVAEYAITTPNSAPSGIHAGPNGNMWFSEQGVNKIGEMTTAGVMVNEFPLLSGSVPDGITTGPDGNLWVAENSNQTLGHTGIARVTTAGVLTEFAIPPGYGGNNSNPVDIVSGPDGNLWYTQAGGNVGRITTAGVITQFPVPGTTTTSTSEPLGIAAGPANTLWFTQGTFATSTSSVGSFDPVPLITALPSSVLASGQTVTMACTGCRGATTVTVGSTVLSACASPSSTGCFTLNGAATAISLPVTAGIAGTTVRVTFTTPYASSAPAQFTYVIPVPATGGA